MTAPVYLSPPDVGPAEEAAVLRALRSGWVAPLGPEVDAFEREVAERVGVGCGVALSSGTAALHLGLLGLGVRPGDVVIAATMTFAATANAIVYTGAEPYFVDCLPQTGTIDPALLREALCGLRAAGREASAIIPVDLLGKSADYTAIAPIADEFGVPVLADAAESLGARHAGRPAGSFGRAAVLSFNGNKIMTTSGGGMLLTEDAELAERTRYLATQARQPAAHYEHTEIGYNYRLSNVLAALGRAQLGRLDEMIRRRRELRRSYGELFASVDGATIFGAADDDADNCWLTAVLVDESVTGWSAAQLSSALAAQGIESRPLWKPMHLQPVFAGCRGTITGAAERLFRTGLALPSGSSLEGKQRRLVMATIAGFLASGGR